MSANQVNKIITAFRFRFPQINQEGKWKHKSQRLLLRKMTNVKGKMGTNTK